jgi:hypothetical protein
MVTWVLFCIRASAVSLASQPGGPSVLTLSSYLQYQVVIDNCHYYYCYYYYYYYYYIQAIGPTTLAKLLHLRVTVSANGSA